MQKRFSVKALLIAVAACALLAGIVRQQLVISGVRTDIKKMQYPERLQAGLRRGCQQGGPATRRARGRAYQHTRFRAATAPSSPREGVSYWAR